MINIDNISNKIKERGAKRVLLQLPEGVIWKGPEISRELENHGIEADIWAEPTYGACDIIPGIAERLGYDLLVHVGHVKFYKPIPDENVLYYPVDIDVSPDGFSGWEMIAEKKIDLLTTVQHLKSMGSFRKKLEEMGKVVASSGYALGCWLPPQAGDAILFVGSGKFHALAEFSAGRGKKVYVADVEKRQIYLLDPSEFEKAKYARIGIAIESNDFGIVVSTKHGQSEIKLAREIKERLEKAGKKAGIIVMNFVSKERLELFKKDMYINTACPRISDDGWLKLINASDMGEVFRAWEKA